ncbi:MAG: ParB/RepB/Spo0J family partition protein [Magnetococcus sp. WYHC-3]
MIKYKYMGILNSKEYLSDPRIQNNAVFFIEVEKIKPNPFQPRREFEEGALRALADSIRMYGVLQPLVVTRSEFQKDDGGIGVEYELIAGERRLRASKLAGLAQVPALIRVSEDSDRMKLEIAIIENLQREDLNAVERARAFQRLYNEFGFKHAEIGRKVGKSREYVTNTLRLLSLPEDIVEALSARKISEGHTRPLMMLIDRPAEQKTLFNEIVTRGLNVRDAEAIARRVAYDRARKKDKMFDPDLIEIEEKMTETLGTRVHIEKRPVGGKIQIDYYNVDDLRKILSALEQTKAEGKLDLKSSGYVINGDFSNFAKGEYSRPTVEEAMAGSLNDDVAPEAPSVVEVVNDFVNETAVTGEEVFDANEEIIKDEQAGAGIIVSEETDPDSDIYSIKNFSI